MSGVECRSEHLEFAPSAFMATYQHVTGMSPCDPPAQARRFAGRKKKKKLTTMQDKVADAALLLKEQIAKANFVTAHHGPSSVLNEERRSSSPASTSTTGSRSRAPTTATLSSLHNDTTEATKSEIIENYFKSQSELKTQIERQYLDRLARNEFADDLTSPSPPPLSDSITDVTDASVLKATAGPPPLTVRENGRAKLKRKWTSTSKSSLPPATATTEDPSNSSPAGLETTTLSSAPPRPINSRANEDEVEILARLPPLDPDLLAEYADFTFEPDPGPEEGPELENNGPSPTYNFNHHPITSIETDPYSHNESAEVSRVWAQQPMETSDPHPPTLPPALQMGKIDWGSDSEDDSDEEELSVFPIRPSSEEPLRALPSVNEVRADPVPEDGGGGVRGPENGPATAESGVVAEMVVLRAVEEAEVERLHSEDVPGLNGNLDKWGCFREWQETLTVRTYGDEDLLILPYTVIDF